MPPLDPHEFSFRPRLDEQSDHRVKQVLVQNQTSDIQLLLDSLLTQLDVFLKLCLLAPASTSEAAYDRVLPERFDWTHLERLRVLHMTPILLLEAAQVRCSL